MSTALPPAASTKDAHPSDLLAAGSRPDSWLLLACCAPPMASASAHCGQAMANLVGRGLVISGAREGKRGFRVAPCPAGVFWPFRNAGRCCRCRALRAALAAGIV